MRSCSKYRKDIVHSFHGFRYLSGKGLSHPSFTTDISFSMHLPTIVAGATNPNGSYKLLMTERTPRRVNGLSV
ncbi:hypothetical protein DPMN_164513 [Dreissena polymorpha]|uniref:Uncharacterized protein n=1 Tax=Dreissena polymorpha TaxID=45954 RepID=A0A9D4EV81_DREPO|nr:hypothetical protein DPMN_164513 [Dreissena polymorpha]